MAKRDKQGSGRSAPVIRREEAAEHGGHGSGAWKVAYADFVTALMAFFLLMWLMNATTEDQRKGLADYFSPTNLMSHNSSGTGQPFGGHTAFDAGALLSDRGVLQVTQGKRPLMTDTEDIDADPPFNPKPSDSPSSAKPQPTATAAPAAVESQTQQPSKDHPPPAGQTAKETKTLGDGQAAQEAKALQAAAEEIRNAVAGDPALAGLTDHLSVDITPEGLRIQILDTQNRSLFPLGSAQPNETARLLIDRIAPVVLRLPEQIVIQGHTDAAPYPGPLMTNWELSASRANAARRLLTEAGLPEKRIREVTGQADHALLLPADPLAPANRRIAILLLRGTGAPVSEKPKPGGP